jgi:hypothetical protein
MGGCRREKGLIQKKQHKANIELKYCLKVEVEWLPLATGKVLTEGYYPLGVLQLALQIRSFICGMEKIADHIQRS